MDHSIMRSGLQRSLTDSFPRISMSHAGQGELVLFLHGIGGNSSNWTSQLEVFSSRYVAVAWDMRGYGYSDDYEGELAFADLSSDILAIMRHFSAESVHLVGLSMGGRIAFDFFHRYPDAVRSLTICSASHRASEMTPERRAKFLASRLDPLLNGKTPADIAPDVARSLLGKNASQEAYAALVASMTSLRAESYMKALRAVTCYEGPVELEAVNVPTHLLAGADDPLIPAEKMRRMAARIPNCRFTELKDCGHLSNIEQPDAFNAATTRFLKNLA